MPTACADGSVAFVCGEEAEAGAIRAGCRAVVADYMVPDRVVFVPELPINVNGKVDYRMLAQHPSLST
jgi:acyl-CoA synthetase (AMP-forming)/AMP-acid ligase II